MIAEPTTRAKMRIGLLETEPLRATGFRSVFDGKSSIEIVTTDIDGLISDKSLSVALLGLHNSADSFETLASIKTARPLMRLILMGPGASDELIINAIAAGAKGYLEHTASADQVEQAIGVVSSGSIWAPRRVLALFVDRVIHSSASAGRLGNSHFTERECEVLKLLVAARSNREIADSLMIEERTVKAHVARLMRKVGVDNRIALSVHAVTNSLLTKES